MSEHDGSEQRCVIDDRTRSVGVVKARTRNGERLHISSGEDRSIHLDALALEGLSWQPGAELDRTDGAKVEFETDVVNEFATVKVRKLRLDGAEFLEVEAPRAGYRIRLTAEALDSLAGQPMEVVSDWLETPLGPEH